MIALDQIILILILNRSNSAVAEILRVFITYASQLILSARFVAHIIYHKFNYPFRMLINVYLLFEQYFIGNDLIYIYLFYLNMCCFC